MEGAARMLQGKHNTTKGFGIRHAMGIKPFQQHEDDYTAEVDEREKKGEGHGHLSKNE